MMSSKIFFRYICLAALVAICSTGWAAAQDRITVRGSVVDPSNEPLAGAMVLSTDPMRGTATDEKGAFTLSATVGEMLTFSSLGYTTLTLPASPSMEVKLGQDVNALEAVTVVGVGYGTMRRSDLTGSIASVAGDNLRGGAVTSAEQVLQGRVAGLVVSQPSGDPTQGSNLRLRGGTSLTASNSPLIVVDGIPGVDMNTIQPSEIASIDVLKDASAAAIYGSRGANGVIIVTTKRSTGGRMEMSYNGYVSVGAVAKNLDLLSANQWRKYVRDNNVAGAVDYGASTDWQKELEQTAISHSHNVAFANSGKNNGFRASIGYLDVKGVVKTSTLKRLSGSITGYQYGLKGRLKLDAGIEGSRDLFNPINIGIWERAYNQNPTLPVMQNGKYTQVGGTNANNPVELLNNVRDDQSNLRLLGYLKAELEILAGLKLTSNVSWEYGSHQDRYYLPSTAFGQEASKGVGRRGLRDFSNSQIETYLTYEKAFRDIHRFTVMAGHSYSRFMYEGFGAAASSFDTDYTGYNKLDAGNVIRMGDVYSYKRGAQMASFFGRVHYSLLDRYMITATLRGDGTSRAGFNHKWGAFPSVSAAWRISEEPFMKGANRWLDNLKLRVGWGMTGNQDNIGEYKSLSLMGVTTGNAYYDAATGTWKQSWGITQNANPDLKWEYTTQTNVGVDFAFLGRFSVSVDAYLKKTSNLLFLYPAPQPPKHYHETMANAGTLVNKGIELTVGADIMRTKNFTWSANLTTAYNHQKVTSLSNENYQTEAIERGNLHGVQGFSGVYTQTLREGYPVGSFWGPKFLGVDDEGKYILSEESEFLGDAQPKWTLGFGMNFTWKWFDASFSGYGMFGQKILNAQGMALSSMGRLPGSNIPDKWLDRRITSAPTYSSYWIEKGDFFRLQNITLGYTVPLKNAWFSRIRVYASAENLFVLTGYTGIDPEVNYSGLLSPGIDKSIGEARHGDNYYYPRPRTFLFGVNLSF